MTTKTLLEYIENNKKETVVRIKFAFEPESEQLDKLERHLKKYDVLQVSAPQRVMLQSTPLDFPDFKGIELYFVDFECELPVSSFMLQQEICKLLNTNPTLIKVRVENEPSEIEQETLEQEAEKAADEEKPEAKLLDPEYKQELPKTPVKQNLYGNKPTADFIKDIRKNTKEMLFAKHSEVAASLPLEDVAATSPISGTNKIPDPFKMATK